MEALDDKMPGWVMTLGRTLAILWLFYNAIGTVSTEMLTLISVLFLSTEMQIYEFRNLIGSQNKTKKAVTELRFAEDRRNADYLASKQETNADIMGLLRSSLNGGAQPSVNVLDEGTFKERTEIRTKKGVTIHYTGRPDFAAYPSDDEDKEPVALVPSRFKAVVAPDWELPDDEN